jgi:hypothetical protein
MYSKVNQISQLLGQMMATTNAQSSIPIHVTAPAPVQPCSSFISVTRKRTKSIKLQPVQSAKLRASSADDIQSATKSSDSAAFDSSKAQAEKNTSQFSSAAMVF